MKLTDIFIKNLKPNGKTQKHSDEVYSRPQKTRNMLKLIKNTSKTIYSNRPVNSPIRLSALLTKRGDMGFI